MGFFSFFHLPKHREFNFQPRYYDPVKEEIQERIKKIKNEKISETAGTRSQISEAFRRRQTQNRASSVNQFILLVFLVSAAVAYWNWGTTGILWIFIPFTAIWLIKKFLSRVGR